MLDHGMYDGLFDRATLISLMTLLAEATDIELHLQRSGWPNTVQATIHSLEVTVKLRPYQAWGVHTIALPGPRMRQLAEQLAEMTADIVHVHLEGREITLRPSHL